MSRRNNIFILISMKFSRFNCQLAIYIRDNLQSFHNWSIYEVEHIRNVENRIVLIHFLIQDLHSLCNAIVRE